MRPLHPRIAPEALLLLSAPATVRAQAKSLPEQIADVMVQLNGGTVRLTAIAPDNEALQRSLAFSPIYLTDGIQLSDDPFPALRAAVYALSVQHRGTAPSKTT